MNIHEYQAKDLLRSFGVAVPNGRVVFSDTQAANVAEELGGDRWAVKAQIHPRGRGKAGGIKIVNSIDEVKETADEMLGMRLVTHETGPKGTVVKRVYVEQARIIKSEHYIGLIIDRVTQRITIIASSVGGVDIDEVAQNTPEKVIREVVDPAIGLHDFQCRKIAYAIGLSGKLMPQAVRFMKQLYRCFRDKDVLRAEINPLAVVDNDKLFALDVKLNFDDNALYRQPQVTEMRDLHEEDPREVDASGHGLSYCALDGNVGCIVNGAGLAMATMDAIILHGGRPANVLDVGGDATPEKVANAFRIVVEDPKAKSILVNIFAGINRCEWIAEGLVLAFNQLDFRHPIVVRLAGTNVEKGNKILNNSGLPFISAENLEVGAIKVLETLEGKRP